MCLRFPELSPPEAGTDANIARLAGLAGQQFGVVGTQQLADLAISRAVVRTHRRRGWLVTAAPRVLAVAGAPPSWSAIR